MNAMVRLKLYLLPSVVSVITSFIMIPLTTARLDPRDYGLFAILYSFNAFLAAIAMMGSSYLWAAYFPRLEKQKGQIL